MALRKGKHTVDAEHLKSVPLFAGLSRRDRETVARVTDSVDVPAGQVLTTEGGLSLEFFVIEAGTATVTRNGEKIAELGPGNFFGEVGVLRAERRNATVIADTPMRLLVVFAQNFTVLEHQIAAVSAVVEKALAERTASSEG
ncbi:MAG: cyclic nucleotide-binding domain-containing protein [Acidimicrobiia bacterium]